MVKIISKKDTTIPVKKDAIIVPRPTEFILCNKMSEMTMDEMVNIKSTFTSIFQSPFLNGMPVHQ